MLHKKGLALTRSNRRGIISEASLYHTRIINSDIEAKVLKQAKLTGDISTGAYDPCLPVDSFQAVANSIHENTNFGWPASLITMAAIFRVVSFPLYRGSLINGWKRASAANELREVREMAREAVLLRDKDLVMQIDREYRSRLQKLGISSNPLAGFGYLLTLQIPWTFTMVVALRGMTTRLDHFASFIFDSQLLWCDSLALPDPYGVFPLVSVFCVTMIKPSSKIHADATLDNTDSIDSGRKTYINYAVRAGSFMFLPLAMHLPISMICFFLFNTIFSRVVGAILNKKYRTTADTEVVRREPS